MKKVFLLLAIAGVAAPYYFIYKFIEANNWEWSTALFFEQINANAGMKILNADLTVAATTFLVFIIYKRSVKSISTKRFITYFASLFLVGSLVGITTLFVSQLQKRIVFAIANR